LAVAFKYLSILEDKGSPSALSIKLSYDDNYFNDLVRSKRSEPVINTKEIEHRIVEIDKQIDRMIDLYQVGNIPMEQISERIEKLKKEKDVISQKLISNNQTKVSVSEAKDILNKIKNTFENGDIPEQRLAINVLIDFIEIDNEIIEIHWNFV
jgi:site-specific DNA recombinase